MENSDPNLKKGSGKFSFLNGDTYDGDYALHLINGTLVKNGEGVYVTDDFNTYSGKWENDNFVEENFFIQHNNGTRYNGGINANGQMSGKGIYHFPDDSSINAIWYENKPVSEITYQDSLGYVWIVKTISDDSIYFMPNNHFWTETCRATTSDDVPVQSSLSILSNSTCFSNILSNK
ncbi:phosphatidylinositol 4-phosphate 5-kinase 6-like [Vespula pensylvanica]|uniref:phosphatidylinositol 4-phosphate 5-kinase 6-like n=1 Tax=Vespula pensylvanica TaxID=30213 RepID=UPI001CB9E758|nr:phosphatidylinositol 4-phosphate 5-kinase 6-like [Vespula pensylvanica]